MALALLLAQADTKVPPRGWQAIVDGQGISISITGMAIVFAALVFISMFIALLPKLLELLDPILPTSHAHSASPSREEQSDLDREKVVAAIGLVLHTELKKVTNQSD